MEVTLQLDEKGKGAFLLKEGGKQLGEMEIKISGDQLTVYHTEIAPEAEGLGLSKRLMEAMTAHAREHKLKVIPMCSYVQGQFSKHAEDYGDLKI